MGSALESVQTVSPGHCVCHPDHTPLIPVTIFTAKIVVFDVDVSVCVHALCTNVQVPLLRGQPVELHAHALCESAHVTRLLSIMDKKTGQPSERRPR
jgi:translation elongation factor EF-1alpha